MKAIYIYIMYSSKLNAYKIGESKDVARRLREVKNGSAKGDSSTVLIDSFSVDEKLLSHRCNTHVDQAYFHLPHNKKHKFKDESWSEWFDITEDEAREAIKKGFKNLKKDNDNYRLGLKQEKINRRFNYALKNVMSKRVKHSKILNTFLLLNKILNKYNEINIVINISDKDIEYFFSNYYRLYINNLDIFNAIITKDIFLKGVLYVPRAIERTRYENKATISYMKKYHNLIIENKDYILNKIKKVRLINDRYSTREAILTLSSRLAWECYQFERAVQENSHLLSLEHYLLYNISKQNEDFYFLRLTNKFNGFKITNFKKE